MFSREFKVCSCARYLQQCITHSYEIDNYVLALYVEFLLVTTSFASLLLLMSNYTSIMWTCWMTLYYSSTMQSAVGEVGCGSGQIYDHLMKLCVSNRPLNSMCPQGYAHNVISNVCEGNSEVSDKWMWGINFGKPAFSNEIAMKMSGHIPMLYITTVSEEI